MKTVIYNNSKLEVNEQTLAIYKDGKECKANLIKGLGRYYVSFKSDDGKSHFVPRARIVCLAFHPNKDYKYLDCDHIDNNPLNDQPGNLRWLSHKDNIMRAEASQKRRANARAKSHTDEVIEVEHPTGDLFFFSNGKEVAAHLDCTSVLVYRVLNENDYAKSAKGCKLKWRKIDVLPKELQKMFPEKVAAAVKCNRYCLTYESTGKKEYANFDEMLKKLKISKRNLAYRLEQGRRGKFVKGVKVEQAD